MRNSIMVRVGLPQTGGALVNAARQAGYPVLFSANAFMRKDADGVRVVVPKAGRLAGLDAALDSAGFVAAQRYRGYIWSMDDYLDLVESNAWAWYSSMDYCVEPEVADSTIEVMFRVAETCRLFSEVRRSAADRGLRPPMPVLQGWSVDQYLWCADHMPLYDWPDLVGVGSMCRREIQGPQGVLAVVEALDKVLPRNVKFHLFGVKGPALDFLAGHERLASVDSMAWDSAARRAHPTGRTAAIRSAFMFDWMDKNQRRAQGSSRGYDLELFEAEAAEMPEDLAAVLEDVAGNEWDARSAAMHLARMGMMQ